MVQMYFLEDSSSYVEEVGVSIRLANHGFHDFE